MNIIKIIIALIILFLSYKFIKYLYYKYTNIKLYNNDKKLDYNLHKCKELIDSYNIKEIDNFLTEQECNHIIKISKDKLINSLVMGTHENIKSEVRTSSQYWLKINTDKISRNISKKVSNLTKLPVKNQEDIQVLHYNIANFYKPHYDNCNINKPYCLSDNKRGGKRVYTVFIYLNDIKEGGGTYFPNLNRMIKPKKGTALLFQNTHDNNKISRHPCSLHEGTSPISGEKWAMNIWVREEEFK